MRNSNWSKGVMVACLLLGAILAAGAAFASVAQAQDAGQSRRGPGRGFSRGSLIGLLRLEQVQQEMKLDEEQTAKVKEVVEKLGAEMREQYAALREMEDRRNTIVDSIRE